MEIQDLKNLGKVSKQRLNSIGIYTRNDIVDKGIVPIYCTLKKKYGSINPVMMYALFGALENIHWSEVPKEIQQKMKEKAQKLCP